MPFGIQTCGVTPARWGQQYGAMLVECKNAMPERDFLAVEARDATGLCYDAGLVSPLLGVVWWCAP